eukprot:536922-Pyramimonas_sp.AAC.1
MPTASKMAPRGAPRFPRGPQEGSKSAPRGSKSTREAPKRPPSDLRAPKMTSKIALIAQAGSK